MRSEGLKDTVFKPYSRDVIGYSVRENVTECRLAAIAEMQFVKEIRNAQSMRFRKDAKRRKGKKRLNRKIT